MRDAREDRRLGLDEMLRISERTGLEMAPLEECGDDLPYRSVEELLERARGTYVNGRIKEGIVVRPQIPAYSPTIGGSLSMKVINNDYLIKRYE